VLGSAEIIGFVPVADCDKARAFYEGVLGLSFVNDDGFAVVMSANGIMLRARKGTGGHSSATHDSGLAGGRNRGRRKQLQGKRVQFVGYGFFKQDELGIWTAPNGDKIAWFKDPDGNTLSLSEHV
jgi:catechol 2,3-dioxygenase-like lactoylglutathione lyase family enzyme